MSPVKRAEILLKHLAGWVLALLWFRPFRERQLRPLLSSATDVFIVRTDNRVGEALLSTPLVNTLAPKYRVHLVVHHKCVRVFEGLPGVTSIHGVDPREGLAGLLSSRVRQLRALTRDAVVINAANCEVYSGMQALMSRAIAPRALVVGPGLGPAKVLMDVVVPGLSGPASELTQRLNLVTPLQVPLVPRMSFREPRGSDAVRAFADSLGSRFVVVNPGGRLGHRRVPVSVFQAAVKQLKQRGVTPVVTWGPGEEALARDVALEVGTVAPPTSLDDLAFLMKQSVQVVCNNTGPMHLSVAVGARTLALFFRMPITRWGHTQAPHVMLDLTPWAADESQMQQQVIQQLESLGR